MRTILVTGPIGSGKSAACRYLASLDFPVYECDARTKMLYSLVPGLKCSIEERLDLPWARIGEVFADPGKLQTLEEMGYPVFALRLVACSGLDPDAEGCALQRGHCLGGDRQPVGKAGHLNAHAAAPGRTARLRSRI